MASKVLQAEPRVVLKRSENNRIRKTGSVPAVVFGKGIASKPITVKGDDFRRIIRQHGRNAIIDVNISGDKTYSVIVKNVTFTNLTGSFEHIDFQKISMHEEVKTEVNLRIIGREMLESKHLILIRQQDSIKIKGLPQNIPEYIEVDVSHMEAGSTLTVGDINLPAGIVAEEDKDAPVLSVHHHKAESIPEPEEATESAEEQQTDE